MKQQNGAQVHVPGPDHRPGASTLDMQVPAEYVETEEQREVLHEIGCDMYQGHLYSPAVFLSEQEN